MVETTSKYKVKIEKIDKAFETKYKHYDPYIKFMKFYIRFKDGKIKRYGATNFYRPGSFYSQNVDFKLYSKNAGNYELKKIIFSSLSYVRRYEYIPYFFYYNKSLNVYCHLKYNKIYDEDEIDDLFAYVIKYSNSKLLILKNKEILLENNDITHWYTNIDKPEMIIFCRDEKGEDFDHAIYQYDFLKNNLELVKRSNSNFIITSRHKLSEIFNKLPSDKALFDDEYVYLYISYSDTESFHILFEYLIQNSDQINIIKNLFPYDTTINYKIKIKRKKKKELQFIIWILYEKSVSRLSIFNYQLSYICENLSFGDRISDKILSYRNNSDINSLVDLIKKSNHLYDDEMFVNFLVKLYKKENIYFLIFKSGYNNPYLTVQSYCEFIYPKPNPELYQKIGYDLYKKNIIASKWKSEYLLYKLIKTYFADAIYQFRDDWLGAQSIDIYIPSLKIAFEYQGLQHYEPVEFFGGDDVLKYNIERDERKKEICCNQEVILIYWEYNEKITKDNLVYKLSAINIVLNEDNMFGISNVDVDNRYKNFNTIEL